MATRVWAKVRIPTDRCEGGEEKRISPLRCSQETRAAPVEMTIPSSGKREQTTANATAWGWVTIDIPPIAECAMDGAPGRFCLVEEGNNRSPSATIDALRQQQMPFGNNRSPLATTDPLWQQQIRFEDDNQKGKSRDNREAGFSTIWLWF
jgi:hypothetical protein